MKDVTFGKDNLAVTLSMTKTGHRCQLHFWRTDNFSEITHLDFLPIPENFVTVFQRGTTRRIYIVSTKTRTIVEKITDSSIKLVRYEQGLLIMSYPSFIR